MSSSVLGTSGGTFVLTLDHLVRPGSFAIKSAACEFSYVWNHTRNTGSATLRTIDGTTVDLPLFAEGIKGTLSFVSDTGPIKIVLPSGEAIILYRVILELVSPDTKKAALILGDKGEEILTTANWELGDEATVARVGKVINATFSSNARSGLSGGRCTLTLDKVILGPNNVKSVVCEYSWIWNHVSNIGSATLLTVNGVPIDIPLFPRGTKGMIEFVSAHEPVDIMTTDGSFTIHRIIFQLVGNTERGGLWLGPNPFVSEFLATQNWDLPQEETVKRANAVFRAAYSEV